MEVSVIPFLTNFHVARSQQIQILRTQAKIHPATPTLQRLQTPRTQTPSESQVGVSKYQRP
ncbi:hypothetical protein BM1_08772 [Bipolaris maydis]|nr:hypothetical protein BM1_08772 [Bipolaris maydis]